MQNKMVFYLLSGLICVLEWLFCYGISVNVFAFLKGIVGGYVLLFTGMTISGALILHAILEHYIKDKKIENTVYGFGITIFALLSNTRIGIILIVLNVFVLRGRYKKVFSYFLPIMSSVLLIYAYRSSWISVLQFLFLFFSEWEYCAKFSENTNNTLFDIHKVQSMNWWNVWKLCLLKLLQNLCIGGMFWCGVISLMHIMNEGALFQWYRVLFGIIIMGVCRGMLYFLENRLLIRDSEFVCAERLSFVLFVVVCAIIVFRASVVLSCLFLGVSVSYVAFEIVCAMHGFAMKKWESMHVLLSVVLVCAELLYDGVMVDSSVVVWSVFAMASFWNCVASFRRIEGFVE